MHQNPYAADLGDLDPFKALGETPQKIRAAVERWTAQDFERSYAPGKWSARTILVHLAQMELALGTRVRYALSEDGYAAQSLDQDRWMPIDDGLDAKTALDVYTTLRRMNVAMWHRLSDARKDHRFTHPEYGELSVRWVAEQMAGHDIHHLKQLEQIR